MFYCFTAPTWNKVFLLLLLLLVRELVKSFAIVNWGTVAVSNVNGCPHFFVFVLFFLKLIDV